MARTNPERSAGPYVGARLFGSFWGDCQKELVQQGETKPSSNSINAYEPKPSFNTPKLASPTSILVSPRKRDEPEISGTADVTLTHGNPNLTPLRPGPEVLPTVGTEVSRQKDDRNQVCRSPLTCRK